MKKIYLANKRLLALLLMLLTAGSLSAQTPLFYYNFEAASGTDVPDVSSAEFDATITLSTVANNDFSITTDPSFERAGNILNGPDGNFTLGDISYMETNTFSPEVNLNTSDFTLAMWVRPTTRSNAPPLILLASTMGNFNKTLLALRNVSGTWYLETASFEEAGGGRYHTREVPILFDTWQHVALVITNGTLIPELYVNGVKVLVEAAGPAVATYITAATSVRFAHSNVNSAGTQQSFVGQMDDVAAYATALTEAQIRVMAGITNVWNGTAWSLGSHAAGENVSIEGAYSGSLTVNDIVVSGIGSITVAAGETIAVSGAFDNAGLVTIQSGGSLITDAAGSFAGNGVVINRNTTYADGKYSFVGSPVTSSATGADLGSTSYWYDETVAFGSDGLARWKDATAQALVAGRGYAQAGQEVISFTGVPNSGTITYSGTLANEGFNLVSNPYPAAINTTEFFVANTNNTGSIYIWDDHGSDGGRGDDGDYLVATSGGLQTDPLNGPSSYNNNIGSMQGFFVQLNAPGNTDVTFTEFMRVSGNNDDANYFRKASESVQYVRLNLTDAQGINRQAVLGWASDASEQELNRLYDAKVFNTNASFMLYTLKGANQLVIQGINESKDAIALGMNIRETGTHTLSLDNSAFAGRNLFLLDRLTNKVIDLSNGSYSFSATQGSVGDRFTLMTSASAVLANDAIEGSIYVFNNVLHLNQADLSSEYRIYNLSGKFMQSIQPEGKQQISLDNLKSGLYVISDGQVSKKFIIK